MYLNIYVLNFSLKTFFKMLIKQKMHPRNIYKNPPDFKELAIQFPDFRKYVKTNLSGKATIDFQDQNALKQLTITLLKKDFDLDVVIDETRLIPRVPQSLNYILWVEDLLEALKLETQPLGIDIGTGSVCIYSLLAAKKGWKMLATELDSENFKYAEKNINQNKLTDLISLKLVSDSKELLVCVIDDNTKYDFCMCNPPFFNFDEKPQNRTLRRRQLETVASEVSTEMSTEGGEVAFISKLIQESVKLKDRIKIFTTLVGKKNDFVYLKKEVQKVCPKSVVSTEFCQGRTIRWGLAWTFLDIDLRNSLNSCTKPQKKSKTKAPMQYVIPSNKVENVEMAFEDLKDELNKLKISFKEESFDMGQALHFKAFENTWSHQRRKKRLLAGKSKASDSLENEECSEAKKPKLDEEVSDSSKSVLVEGVVSLKDIDSSVVFELTWMSGDKEALHQIFQHFRNYWSTESKT